MSNSHYISNLHSKSLRPLIIKPIPEKKKEMLLILECMSDAQKNKFFTWSGIFIALFGIGIVTTCAKLLVEKRTPGIVLVKEGIIFALLLLLVWIVKKKEKQPLISLGLQPNKLGSSIVWGLLCAVACAITAVITLTSLQYFGITMTRENVGQAPLPIWVTIIVLLRAGIVEEVFFRGYAITRLSRYSPTVAIILPLIIFSSLHYGQGLAGVIVSFTMGGVLTLFFLKRNDLLAVIIGHFLVDFVPNVLMR